MTIKTYTLPELDARLYELDKEIEFLGEFTRTGGEYSQHIPSEYMRKELAALKDVREFEKQRMVQAKSDYMSNVKIEVDLSVPDDNIEGEGA